MNKPVNPKSPWRTFPAIPQTNEPTKADKQQEIDYAAKRLAKIDVGKTKRGQK